MKALWPIMVALALVAASPVFAVQPDEILSDPALESRARALSQQLRCMVCQNQSIDDSDAPLARDLRLLVRERLVAGDSDAKVIDFLTARYGEFVLLKPRFSAVTALLWLAPLIALMAGAWVVVVALRRRNDGLEATEGSTALDANEQARVSELLDRSAR